MMEWILSSHEAARHGTGLDRASTRDGAWTREVFEEKLRQKVHEYHTAHPFHRAMVEGRLTREQIQGWVLNRFYYQATIPRKDAAILSNCSEPAFRRKWIRRIYDQDGFEDGEGGLESWLRLAEACGLSRDEVFGLSEVLPGVRFACDAYLHFARQAPWQEAVCSSLTELFAHQAHKERIESFPRYYPWIAEAGLAYFKDRVALVQIDVKHSLEVTFEYFNSRALQEKALDILTFKLDILWQILESIEREYGIGEPRS